MCWYDTNFGAGDALVAEMPHGGFKHAGQSKDLSMYGFEDCTRIKHVMSNLSCPPRPAETAIDGEQRAGSLARRGPEVVPRT